MDACPSPANSGRTIPLTFASLSEIFTALLPVDWSHHITPTCGANYDPARDVRDQTLTKFILIRNMDELLHHTKLKSPYHY